MPGVALGGALPAALLAYDAWAGQLGANPLQRATQQTGQLALILLLLSLACTPWRQLTGQTWPARVRKALGLLAFGYAALHLACYLTDKGVGGSALLGDLLKRPFIASGLLALALLVPLALTSRPASVRRLGFARWTRLHRLVYPASLLAALHYWWGVKEDRSGPLLAGALLLALLGWRVWKARAGGAGSGAGVRRTRPARRS